MKKTLPACLVLPAILWLSACTGTQIQLAQAPGPNPRVIERDLTKPYSPEPAAGEGERHRPGRLFVIDFDNGSSALKTTGVFTQVYQEIGEGDEVLIVGHSHGRSDERSIALATQRAMAVGTYLQRLGAKKVYLMASWGPLMNSFDPVKGAQIFIMKSGGVKEKDARVLPTTQTDEGKKKI